MPDLNFRSHFLMPVLAVVAATIAALIGGLFWLTAIQNKAEGVSEQARVAAAFRDRVSALEATTHVFAVWDEAALRLAIDFDPAWADVNEAAYLFEQFGYEHTFIVDKEGRPLYAATRGRRSQVDPRQLIGSGFLPALAQARKIPSPRSVAGVGAAPAGPVIFGVARLRGNSAAVNRRIGHAHFLVIAKNIDASILDQVSRLARDPGSVSFSSGARGGPGNWPVSTYDGATAGTLHWSPDFTGTRLRTWLLPWLGILIFLIVLLAATVVLRARDALRLATANQVRANYLAGHDALTGLPNRRSFLAYLNDVRRGGAEYVLYFLDLDGFKDVNDTFGHAAGDTLLRKTGQRLGEFSPDGAFVARLGGDEFAVVVVDQQLPDEALGATATKLAAIVQEPHEFGGAPTVIGVSIGIAVSGHQENDAVIREADAAMYAAKGERRNGWKLYSPSVQESQWTRKEMENDLRCALANGQISLVFQPILRLRDKRVCAVEALARWTHPEKGEIPPDVFIPIAEESGLIVELGQFILRTACNAALDWPFKLNVNLSPAQFWDRNLVAGVIATLAETGFPAARLEFEITETYLNRRTGAAAGIVAQLRRIGATIALDDFGSGYASIAYLRAFKFDIVKVDRSIIERVAVDQEAAEMLVAIIALCSALKLPCLAEGVETQAQAAICRSAGCQYIQGWHVGLPMPAALVWTDNGSTAATAAE